jgi:hypothetical protein
MVTNEDQTMQMASAEIDDEDALQEVDRALLEEAEERMQEEVVEAPDEERMLEEVDEALRMQEAVDEALEEVHGIRTDASVKVYFHVRQTI